MRKVSLLRRLLNALFGKAPAQPSPQPAPRPEARAQVQPVEPSFESKQAVPREPDIPARTPAHAPETAPTPSPSPAAAEPSPATPEPRPATPSAPETTREPDKKAATTPVLTIEEYADSKLKFESFKFAAWGLDNPENRRAWERIHDEAQRRHDARLQYAIGREREAGERAYALGKELERRFKRDDQQIDAWLEEIKKREYFRIGRHLEHQIDKLRRRKAALAKRRQATPPTSTLKPVTLREGHHPNSLRHLPSATEWTVLVDETGNRFSAEADSDDTTAIGRLVAIALPQGVTLSRLDNFHAADVPGPRVDQALGALQRSNAGVFGYSVREPLIHAGSWFGHIVHLLRWVLWQLPVPENKSVHVEVHVENRGAFVAKKDLDPVAELLTSEFAERDPARYGKLRLNLRLVGKDDPLIGYADVVAFTWGSPSRESQDRLRKSRLLGHCLLRPGENSLERLFLALNADGTLPPDDWYTLVSADPDEPGSLLAQLLGSLGVKAQADAALWQDYLDATLERLRRKRFVPRDLAQAVAWLNRWAPSGRPLPATLRLQLEAARLAAENHQGQVNPDRARTCLALVHALKDEAPAETCETVLRLAVQATNAFEFNAYREELDRWLAAPVAVPGLANHAKLLSLRGQLDAFGGRHHEAMDYFEQALALFERLSDPQQAARETAQTATYRLIALMDTPEQDAEAVFAELRAFLQRQIHKNDVQAISRSLAASDDDRRFLHHLWLRALVTLPQVSVEAAQAYLAQSAQWQTGTAHPWPLIEAYRAWLLQRTGRHTPAAEAMTHAIEACAEAEHGPTLAFMGEVLRTLAAALGIETGVPDTESPSLQERLPHAPHAALARFGEAAAAGTLNDREALRHLSACLPFNFH